MCRTIWNCLNCSEIVGAGVFSKIPRPQLEASVCHGLDGGGILGRGHAGYFFELPGEVMDGGVPQGFGDLGEVHPAGADHLFGRVDLHVGKVFDHAQGGFLLEQLLELGAADQVVPADLFDGDVAA